MDAGKTILGWWSQALGNRESAAARGLAARLRRADMIGALTEPQVHALAQSLKMQEGARLARLVQVLAHVREHRPATLARLLGGTPPALSKERFERLLRSEPEGLGQAVVRALPHVAYKCNVAALGEDLLDWTDDRRARWTFAYFGAEAPEPASEET